MEDSTLLDNFFRHAKAYHIRITGDDCTLDRTYELFKDHQELILSEEGFKGNSGEPYHQHMMLTVLVYSDSAKKMIKDKIYKEYPNLARGNAGHSITQMRNSAKLASYVLKDGAYKVIGFSEEFIHRAIILSYDQKKIKKAFTDLLDSLIVDDIGLEEYAHQYFQLKGQSGQKVIMHNFRGHYLSVAIRKGVMDTRVMASNEYERLQMMYGSNQVQKDLKNF